MSDEERNVSEETEESLLDNSKPLGKQAPGAPFAVVGLTYPFALLVITALLALGYWLF